MTSLDSQIKDVKKHLEELIKQKETQNLCKLCNISENKYIHDLKVDLKLDHEEANENEYADYIRAILIISYHAYLNKEENEKVKVILTVEIFSDKTHDCREIVDKYFDIDVQVISDISIKIANLREQIKTLLLKIKSKSGLNFLDKPGRFWKATKTEVEEDIKGQKEAEDKFNNKIRSLLNEIKELKKKDVDYELNDEQGYLVINHKKKMHFSKVAGALVPSADNWEVIINRVFKYVGYSGDEDCWLDLMKKIKYKL